MIQGANTGFILGTVIEGPNVRFSNRNQRYITFVVATLKTWYAEDGSKKESEVHLPISTRGKTGDYVMQNVKQDSIVSVTYSLGNLFYDSKGVRKRTLIIQAEGVNLVLGEV